MRWKDTRKAAGPRLWLTSGSCVKSGVSLVGRVQPMLPFKRPKQAVTRCTLSIFLFALSYPLVAFVKRACAGALSARLTA